MAKVFIVMGVSGSGKTTVGRLLAEQIGCSFYDGDDFHPPENVAMMGSGIPLTDADRAPWLARLAMIIQSHLDSGLSAVVACSALKRKYRNQLRIDPNVQFVFLNGDLDLISERMSLRGDHYMKPAMLRSQFEVLQRPNPDEALIVDIEQSVSEIVEQILGSTQSRTT